MDDGKADFFISYTQADTEWAEWISWTLEHEGYSCIIQAWDFPPGTNFVLKMQEATARAGRVIAVLSPDYLNSNFAQPEWAAMFASDPQGLERRLIPIMVRDCTPPGMFKSIVQIRLFGIDAEVARETLLSGLRPERAKPTMPPPFPGRGWAAVGQGSPEQVQKASPVASSQENAVATLVPSVAAGPLEWIRTMPMPIITRSQIIGASRMSSRAVLEVHLVPARDSVPLDMRVVAGLPGKLIEIGRQQGLFDLGEAVNADTTSNAVWTATGGRQPGLSGIAVTRSGQRATWTPLPGDRLGSIFDPEDVIDRVRRLLHLLSELPLSAADFAPAAVIEPANLLAIGNVAAVGTRSSATLTMSEGPVVSPPEGSLRFNVIRDRATDIAEELTVRLQAALRERR
ncbi:toll/interleukin-1 receptor domain-containing protein [Microtetraspora malaysiensis]|uniref:toll/interleukin-1 receptor domain-containing protein n=1 Tax=Microtetraspora malaysiensis TaxID=161358 RepID=UPI003D8BC8AD